MEFYNLLLKLSKSFLYLTKSGNYCTSLELGLQTELLNHYRKQARYFQLLTDLRLRQSGPSILSPSIRNEHQAVISRADNHCNKLDEELAMIRVELEKIEELTKLATSDGLKTRASEDPVGIETEMNQAIVKIKEIKSKLESLKVEWNGVKDGLNDGFDSCIQQVNLLLQQVIAQELGPIEE